MDKYLGQYFVKIKRPFSEIEAMFSYSLDIDNGKSGSIIGYATQWQWSRNKVRRFLRGIRTDKGHIKDSKRTQKGQPIHFIDKALMGIKDSKRTDKGQIKDSKRTPSINPNPNPNPKYKEILQKTAFAGQAEPEFYLTKKKRKMSGKRLETFESFWVSFGDKRDKANASDAWLDIPALTDVLVSEIVGAAKTYSSNRQELKNNGNTPKMAQGWLSARRWEDEQEHEETDAEYAKRRGLN